ncbi:MAG: 4-(cytidine 5'-diphospho)-2-C-methyl-D-erythritol kinase [bacterium]|nr:4-(cytidine 5'-diphospho)-2-C-methyl-D-erythritol kinase [bacterium]
MFVKRITSDSLIIGAPAKVNLFLQVLRRRPDGYHDLNSLFQAVSLFDRLTFTLSDSPDVTIVSSRQDIGPVEHNLVTKTWKLLQSRLGIKQGINVNLEKNIPVGGGLGGGSADAAATLIAANLLLNLQLTEFHLADIGAHIGSDVPFFFTAGQAIAQGRGELLTETDFPTDYWIVLVTPNLQISTAESYASLKMTLTEPKNPFKLTVCRTAGELFAQLALSGNDFEGEHRKRYPVLTRIAESLTRSGASVVRMSGSGATMFGLFETAPECDNGLIDGEPDWQVQVVRPVQLSRC